ncbi:hypothetical protein [Comamonas sp.]|jgi:hypothetical protein|uniref:hypothetical protein n=1 Tax=Comamonas sp. TaxID=34028 RepID=UPI002647AF04|nr:hypothetical protein [Comamonas sp.]MDN5537352.1 hypothetical protein [Comamonas sp.]
MASFPQILLNRLWHSTTPARYELIIETGAILPEPDIPDASRYCTAQGPKHYPYVRTLGGVSLFDFSDFNPDAYSEKYVASWFTFVPINNGGGNKIWIEINRDLVRKSLIEGIDLVSQWKRNNAYGHNIMPIIEVAHIGPIDTSKFTQVLQHVDGSWQKIR